MSAPAAFTRALAAFFDRHPLAEDAVYQRQGLDPESGQAWTPADIKVQFYEKFAMQDVQRFSVEAQAPRAFCKTSDVEFAKHGDGLTVRDVNYMVRGVQPTGAGTTWLVLSLN